MERNPLNKLYVHSKSTNKCSRDIYYVMTKGFDQNIWEFFVRMTTNKSDIMKMSVLLHLVIHFVWLKVSIQSAIKGTKKKVHKLNLSYSNNFTFNDDY